MKRVIAVTSDQHIFSRYGLNPPRVFLKEGLEIKAGPGQKQIWKSWLNFCGKCDEFEVDTVLVLGDLLHGQNPIEMGTMLYSPSMDEQVDAGVEVLSPLELREEVKREIGKRGKIYW